MNFEKQKADLWLRASLENIKTENYSDQQKKIAKGIERVSVNVIYQQAMHLRNVTLPAIEKKDGINSANYKFWKGVATSLLWAICLVDRNDIIEAKQYRMQMELQFYKEHAAALERQFNKYATLEDLFLSSGLDVMAEGVAQRARDLLNSK